MLKILGAFFVFIAVVIVSAMIWQHARYLNVRRSIVHDRQAAWHSRSVFHVLVFVTTAPGTDLFEELRALKRATEGSGARWIYAGKAVVVGRASAQMGEKDWSAIALLQYPSRAAYERHAQTEEMRAARSRFVDVYVHGFERSAFGNAMIPQGLLALRASQLVRGRPSHFPFEPADELGALPEAQQIAQRLRAERELGADAVVIVNLIQEGTPEQVAADRRYALSMLGAMAEGGYGPLHMGRAVTVERDYEFDTVAIVYYPGVGFFADMATSRFFQGIVGDKQLGDTQAVVTVPILHRL
jgi:hypothetical protein